MSTSRTTAVGPGDPWYDTGPENVGTLHAAVARIMVCTIATLSAGVSSRPSEVTLATLVTSPAVVAVADNVVVIDWPALNVPTEHMTCPAAIEQLPCDVVACEMFRPAGGGSVIVTPLAAVTPRVVARSGDAKGGLIAT